MVDYFMQVDLNPEDDIDDYQDDLVAENDDDAIKKAEKVLKSGAHHPKGTDKHPNKDMKIRAELYRSDGHIATITVGFVGSKGATIEKH